MSMLNNSTYAKKYCTLAVRITMVSQRLLRKVRFAE